MMVKTLGNKDFWLAALRVEGAAIRAALAEVPLDTPVPSCPDWTVLDLLTHLGTLYGWVAGHVSRGVTSRPDRSAADQPGPAAGTDAWAWWDEHYQALLSLLDALDPELPAWNWAPQAKRVGFWQRRMAHETSVHRWDAQFAVINAEPIEPKLAADAVTEVLDTFLPAGRRREPTDASGVVGLYATDIEHQWIVRLRGGAGIALLDTDTLLDTDAHHERAVARGTASDLLLALWGRVRLDVLDLTGDERLLRALRIR